MLVFLRYKCACEDSDYLPAVLDILTLTGFSNYEGHLAHCDDYLESRHVHLRLRTRKKSREANQQSEQPHRLSEHQHRLSEHPHQLSEQPRSGYGDDHLQPAVCYWCTIHTAGGPGYKAVCANEQEELTETISTSPCAPFTAVECPSCPVVHCKQTL